MSQKENSIITDSCVDFSDSGAIPGDLARAPFTITVDGVDFLDRMLDVKALLAAMKRRSNKISTACPAPSDFLSLFSQKANNFVVTISSKLSGAYNSAMLAKDMFFEEVHGHGWVHVFDSKSAAAGETLVALKVRELNEKDIPFQDIVTEVTDFISKLRTFFILDSLDNLAKNGRISKKDGIIGSMLHITPIMGENGDGEIEMKAKAIGWKSAVKKLVDIIGTYDIDFKNAILGITHVDALERALAVKDEILAKYSFKDVLIFRAGGLSAAYADQNGIIMAFATR